MDFSHSWILGCIVRAWAINQFDQCEGDRSYRVLGGSRRQFRTQGLSVEVEFNKGNSTLVIEGLWLAVGTVKGAV
jgi:hypothetical protein